MARVCACGVAQKCAHTELTNLERRAAAPRHPASGVRKMKYLSAWRGRGGFTNKASVDMHKCKAVTKVLLCKRTSEGEAMRDATRDDSPPRAGEVRAHRTSERARRSEARRGSTLELASKTMRMNMCTQQKQSVYMTWTVHVQALHLRNREKRANEGGRPNAREEALLTAWLQRGREPTREVRPKTREESSSAHSLLWVRAGGAGRHNPSADFFLAARGEAAKEDHRETLVGSPGFQRSRAVRARSHGEQKWCLCTVPALVCMMGR